MPGLSTPHAPERRHRRTLGSMPSSRVCWLALLVLVHGCHRDHGTDGDAGSSTLDAGACADPTPIDQFDALVPRLLAALDPSPSADSHRFVYDTSLVYVRARIAAGAVVIDASRVDACLARLSTFGLPDGATSPCPDVFRPRCPPPPSSRCGSDIDCALTDFCAHSSYLDACQRLGHCAPRAPLGSACVEMGCAWPETGVTSCTRDASGQSVCRALTSEPATPGSSCDELVAGADGALTVLPSCTAPLVCLVTGDATHSARTCSPVTAPGTLPDGSRCAAASDCIAPATCDSGFCAQLPDPCSTEGLVLCPNGFACVAGACIPTDGSAGAPCGRHVFFSDCAIGLACGDDLHCGPLLPDGALVGDLTPGECASMCATAGSGSSPSTTTQHCIPLAP